jgi:capsular polysaccharide biosynthesis protein
MVEESVPCSPASTFQIGASLRAIDTLRRFAPAPRTALIEYFELDNVVFDGQTGAVFKDGIHVHETRYSTQPSHVFDVDSSRVSKQSDPRLTFVGFHAWHHNYYHWMTQCLPSMFWSLRAGDPSDMVFALPRLNLWQEHTLELAGLRELEFCSTDSHAQYEVNRLAYTTFTQGASTYRPSIKAVEFFRTLRSRVERMSASADSVIYVSRKDANVRNMANEAELCERLQEQGVEIVIPSQLSLEMQIDKFRNAKAVLGPHGAGLTNIIFCEAGAALYEIMSDRKPNPCYAILAQAMGINYQAEAFRSISSETGQEEWCADLEEVLKTAQTLMLIKPVSTS